MHKKHHVVNFIADFYSSNHALLHTLLHTLLQLLHTSLQLLHIAERGSATRTRTCERRADPLDQTIALDRRTTTPHARASATCSRPDLRSACALRAYADCKQARKCIPAIVHDCNPHIPHPNTSKS